MKKNIKKALIVVCSVIMGILIYACSDTSDDYLQYVEGGEILYIGKLEFLTVFPGYNRAQLLGKIPSDPKATEVRIYWNSNKDSLVAPIDRTGGNEVFSTIIDNLDENIYSFAVRTFDNNGNKSVLSTITGTVYGEGYIATLFNRPILSSSPGDAGLEIIFDTIDTSSGAIGTEVVYTATDDTEKSVFVPISESIVLIPDFKTGTSISFRTAYLPQPTAIDIFYTDYDSITPRPTPSLKNAAQPFQATLGSGGRWGTLNAPWITNTAAKSHYGASVGGYDNGCCNDPVSNASMNLECGWGEPAFANAKVYQTTVADEGKPYRLTVNIGATNYSGGSYIVVALGNGIPDVNAVTTAPNVLGYHLITGAGIKTIDFTLSQISTISVGQVSTQSGDRFCNIRSWQITEL